MHPGEARKVEIVFSGTDRNSNRIFWYSLIESTDCIHISSKILLSSESFGPLWRSFFFGNGLSLSDRWAGREEFSSCCRNSRN